MNEQKLEPGERIDLLCEDLTDTNVWLKDKHLSDRFSPMVDYYHHQKFSKDIAYVVILGPAQEKRRAIRATATPALNALGWRIVSDGGDDVINAQPHSTRDLSAHERLRAIGRIEASLRNET